MKLAVLFTGGKDSCFALYRAMQKENVKVLVTIISRNPESYMFHTPNIKLVELQSRAIGLPLVRVETEGEKEKELEDLKKAIEIAIEKHKIEGVVSGAVQSVYQATRIQRICDDLGIWCFNPLWQIDEFEYLKLFVNSGFKALISSVSAYPFDDTWLGKTINEKTIDMLIEMKERFGISPIGEGGEFETFVYDGPIFKKRIEITHTTKSYENYSGVCFIDKARLVEK